MGRWTDGQPGPRAVPAPGVSCVVIEAGNMIDLGQPQRRQLICRHRLAPRSELSMSYLNQQWAFPLDVPEHRGGSCVCLVQWSLIMLAREGVTGWQQIARRLDVQLLVCLHVGRVVPALSHRISTINAGGMAALLRSETTNPPPLPNSLTCQSMAGAALAAWQMRRRR